MKSIFAHASLTSKLTRRELDARFRGSMLGWFWAIIAPLAMLLVFSLVFGTIMGSRWQRPGAVTSPEYSYPLILFIGLIVFNFLADQINRAPGLVLENVSYVKKVVFPLEILPVISMLSSLVTASISFLVFLSIYVGQHGLPPATALLAPLAILPIILFGLGISYLLASLGVFLRDLRHVTPPLTTAMMFLSSIFYDPASLPEQYRWIVMLNPLSPAVNFLRDVLFWGVLPDVAQYLAFLGIGFLVYIAGSIWFSRTQKAFADVV